MSGNTQTVPVIRPNITATVALPNSSVHLPRVSDVAARPGIPPIHTGTPLRQTPTQNVLRQPGVSLKNATSVIDISRV